MPRRANRPRTWQQRFRSRLAEEQERQGLTDPALAARVSEHYPMTASTVWKIKSADPPRKVDLDEALGIVVALGFDSLEDYFTGHGIAYAVRGMCEGVLDGLEAADRQVQAAAEILLELADPTDRGNPADAWQGVADTLTDALRGLSETERDSVLNVMDATSLQARIGAEQTAERLAYLAGNIEQLAKRIAREAAR